jgi:tRNA A37 methylthiotransferase MiaB
MNREYTRGEFEQVADGLNEHLAGFLLRNFICKNNIHVLNKKISHIIYIDMGGFTLATDVICGFPGETDQDFEDTMSLFHKYHFAVLNISQFYARPGTPAAKMRRVPNGVAKSRSKALTTVRESVNKRERECVCQQERERGGEEMQKKHTHKHICFVLKLFN